MSYQQYQQPHDPYIHSNASRYDNQYAEPQGYSDSPNPNQYGYQTPQSDAYYKEGAGAGAGAYGGAPGSGVNPG